MKKTALLMLMAIALVAPEARAGQAPQQSDLPVSMDRIRKALTVPGEGPTIERARQQEEAAKAALADGTPRFATRTETEAIKLRSYLDDGTAVPSYVRAPFDRTHYEFLEMTTPDDYKGCAQFSNGGCASAYTQRAVSGMIWDQFAAQGFDRLIDRLFSGRSAPAPQPAAPRR